jgi:hypothetical protein
VQRRQGRTGARYPRRGWLRDPAALEGPNGSRYTWHEPIGAAPIAAAPDWLVELARRNGRRNGSAPPVEAIIRDGRRNATLTSIGGSMRRRGMEEPEILVALLAVNGRRCKPALERAEVERIAASVARYAPAEAGDRRVTHPDVSQGRAPGADPSRGGNGTAPAEAWLSPCVTAREFRAIERPPLCPYLATPDEKTVLLARENVLLVAGPSGLGKSVITVFDMTGQLAADGPSEWLGLKVRGGLRVLVLLYEGSDEDNADRAALFPDSAQDRMLVWDRWRARPLPQADEKGLADLAETIRHHEIDVVVVDTWPALIQEQHPCDKGIPDTSFKVIEQLRLRTDQDSPLSFSPTRGSRTVRVR